MNQIKNKFMKIKNLSLWVLLAMFIVSGLMQGNFFGRNVAIAYVGKIAIKGPEIRSFMNMLASQLPKDINVQEDDVQQYLFQQAKIMLMKRALLTNECKKLSLVVSDEKVIETIKNDRQFFIDGRFARSKFLETLNKIGFSEMEYKKFHKENLLHQQYIFMLQNSYNVPKKISQNIAKAYLQKRDARYSMINLANISVAPINNKQLEKFYNDNINLFQIPEKKIFKILIFNDNTGIEKVNKLLEKQKFDQIEEKKLESLSIMSDDAVEKINALVPEVVLNKLHSLALNVGENSALYTLSKKRYAAKLVQIVPQHVPKFANIKSLVHKVYCEQYRFNKAKPENWIAINGIKFGSFYLGVPDLVSQAIFMNPIGKMARYDEGGKTYFVIVDKIINKTPNQDQLNNAEKSIKEELLGHVVQSALNSLELKYKIRVIS
jgi:hypothetical protein